MNFRSGKVIEEQQSAEESLLSSRAFRQWLLAPLVPVIAFFGWKYTSLGFLVLAIMLTGMIGGFLKGRWTCGNLCPRGSFLDRFIRPFASRRPIPKVLKSAPFRWFLFSLLMGFVGWRISADLGSVEHWGRVFWSMCALTSGIGVVSAFFIHPRAWCAFCPVGTFQGAVGRYPGAMKISHDCRECGACEKACTMVLPIVQWKEEGEVREKDCVRCSECLEACPQKALEW